MRVGFIGFGPMGVPMVEIVIRACYELSPMVHRHTAPLGELRVLGGKVFPSKAGTAREAEVAITILAAIGSIARHLAGSTYWMLKKGKRYHELKGAVLSTKRWARKCHVLFEIRYSDCDISSGQRHAAKTAKV